MESVLIKINQSLQEAISALEGPLKEQRLNTLLTTDSLPDKRTWELASQTVDLADQVVRLLRPPSLQLAESYLAYLDTKCICTVVENDIPDILGSSSLTVEELAERSGLQALRLKQIMRVLHNNGIFEYDSSSGKYANSPSSRLLDKGHWTQWHRWVDLYGNEFYDAARAIPAQAKLHETRCAAQIHYGTEKSIFEYFAEKGMQDKFHKTLGAGAVAQARGLLEAYDWTEVGDAAVLDIGGGGGDFIASLMRKHEKMRGAVFELPSVVDMLRDKFAPGGSHHDLSARLAGLHAGDFLVQVPPYEVYTMKWCLHNWSDEHVSQILSVIHAAILRGPRARLVVIESVLAEGRSSRVWRYGDLIMMATANGQERTEGEWRGLAEGAGWRVESVTPLRNAWAAAIDLRPA